MSRISVAPPGNLAILLNVWLCDLTLVRTGVETLVGTVPRLWSKLAALQQSISARFLIVSGVVLCLAMAVLGAWVNSQIKHSVLVASGAQADLFMRAFIEPLVQDLEPQRPFDAEEIAAFEELLVETPLRQIFVSVKIWRADGMVLYATNNDLIGQIFDAPHVGEAARGAIVTEFESVVRAENAFERSLSSNLIEVYAPLYRTGTGEVLAVAETYENADELASELVQSQRVTWLVVALTTSVMIGMLYVIVRQATQTITTQRRQLHFRYAEARRLAKQTTALKITADQSRLRASEETEHFLHRIGSDIHDGPIQLLTLSTLRLTAATRALKSAGEAVQPLEEQIEGAVEITQDALAELRNISAGLSLPEISRLDLEQTIRRAVQRHEAFTGDKIALVILPLPGLISDALKTCVFRIVQEGLNNAAKYARDAEKQVFVKHEHGEICIDIHDQGPGMPQHTLTVDGASKLGLAGMRNRVISFYGHFEIRSGPDRGTHLSIRLPINQETLSAGQVDSPLEMD